MERDIITEYFTMNGRYYMGQQNMDRYREERKRDSDKRRKKIVDLVLELVEVIKEEVR